MCARAQFTWVGLVSNKQRKMYVFASATAVSVLYILLINNIGGDAAGDNAASEFFLGFSKNHRYGGGDTLTLVISNTGSYAVGFEVYSPYHGNIANGIVYPSSYYNVSLESSLTVDYDYQRNKGVWVRTTNPDLSITVSAMNYETYTADAFLALPPGPVLQEYIYISNSMLWTNRTGYTFPSLILLVGTQDNTAITITPTQYITIPDDLRDVNNPQPFVHPGQSYTVILNRLETYQIENNLDLTGSRIVSNKPVSVFTGHECTDVPGSVEACDHLFEQVPSTSTWGRFFFLVSSNSEGRTSPEWYRIVASKQSTTVTLTCYSLQDSLHSFSYHAYIAAVGGFEQFQMERDNYCYAVADKPVLVMQYAYGGSVNNGIGDPFMMMILSTEQYVTNTTIPFWAYDYFTNDITIVVLQQDNPSGMVQLDSSLVAGEWMQLYCSEGELCGYTLRLPVNAGYHQLRHIDSTVPVAVYVYGFEYYQGYGYPAALSLKNLEVLECTDGRVRLVDGPTATEGRVEVCQGGRWGTICNDHWTVEDTDVVCGELGLLSTGITNSFYGEGEGPILLDNVECLGVETTILECQYDSHTSDCRHSQDVGAVCIPYPEPVVEVSYTPNTERHYTGYDVTLTCYILINAEVVNRVGVAVTWTKDGITYRDNWDSRISVTPVILASSNTYTTTLQFTQLTSGDSGSYKCVATLTGYSGNSLANASDTVSLDVESLPQKLIQLQFFGFQNCNNELNQLSSTGADQQLATTISSGVEEICECGFTANNLDQIILQCFPDNSQKMNVLLLLQETPTRNISEILNILNMWISGNPQISLNGYNSTLGISSECDIEKIQGSECNTNTPKPSPTPDTPTSFPVKYNQTESPSTVSESKGHAEAIAGGVLLVVAIIVIVIAVVIVIVVLARFRVIKVGSFRIGDRLHTLHVRYKNRGTQRQEEDKAELTKDDGNEETVSVVVDPGPTDQDTNGLATNGN